MATTLFKDTTYTVRGLVEDIQSGEVALPDLQRPFVWNASKARDLLDSMYRGFPVGYLLFWETGAEVGTRQIGSASRQKAPRLLIVDGQQRLTSLYAVMTGTSVVHSDYTEGRIRIAFRPTDATFAVTDAAIEKDPEYISDISPLWQSGERRKITRTFLDRLSERRDLSQDERDRLDEAIDQLHDLEDYPFKAVELGATVDEEQVAEVFVRINSEGVKLNQADFILTLMSVFFEEGRRRLENFSRTAITPSASGASPFNWYLQPSPPQMLRVAVALGFKRAALGQVYTLLRGKDIETGRVDTARRDEQFKTLDAAIDKALNLVNWHEFLLCLERAGFRGSKMISSDNAVLFSYALWLIGREEFKVPLDKLREVVARWFFMAQTTGRYTGAFESQFEQDASRVSGLDRSKPAEFIAALDRVVEDVFTRDYWTITLPNELATSASKSPALLAYIAGLNVLDATPLLSTGRVRARLDPAVTSKKGIERHHIFPRAYLRNKLGIRAVREINQIANMALVEWADNINISDDAPEKYWPAQLDSKGLGGDTLAKQMFWHALPEGWTGLDYQDFLAQRRVLMSEVVRQAFDELRQSSYAPTYPTPTSSGEVASPQWTGAAVTLFDLIEADILPRGATLRPVSPSFNAEATVLPDGRIVVEGEIFNSPSGAGGQVSGNEVNGWTFWEAETENGTFSLSALRDEFSRLDR